ncbi:hypothetical protein [Streptomyces spiramenti]|uniref:Uncharacterized protein n=1 Tax=Streptomyces spiramenti TaxID=2720606 RepID=A0ABX1ANI0_9ACTN|nr:hypothetical protein [Streptomyces spiramenti]NJP67241.1 hypothetical protein [Streptomyces spiramenti]
MKKIAISATAALFAVLALAGTASAANYWEGEGVASATLQPANYWE